MEFFNLNENSVLVSWKDELNSSLTRLISSYKTEILSLYKDLFLKMLIAPKLYSLRYQAMFEKMRNF